ncbi:MAG: DUF86 domain-containing protein, partial [Gemmatimonadales bacterium]|nr:DUF86 domain-containing protein [Gemmatimonadales bacterium]NIP07013.1 DUF86 domain-containing protein [Gemmatimonadales bacterium]
PPEDEVLLRDMLDHARRAVAAVAEKQRADLESDFILAAALERFIEVIGEAASKVSAETRADAAQIPWREIVGMRNRLVHGYASVDHDIVWDVVTGDLAEVIDSLEALLDDKS